MKRKALGRGLDALLPTADNEVGQKMIDVDQLVSNRKQPRMNFPESSLAELSDSIKENGIVQPIIVRRHEDRYEIIAGERRWRAAQLAGVLKVPVVIMDVPDEKMLELALLENIQREDLNPIDEARAYRILLEENVLKQEDLARRLGKARSTIANSVRLLQFPQSVQDMLETGRITAGQARPLLALSDEKEQIKLAETIEKKQFSAREVEKIIARASRIINRKPYKEKEDPHVKAAELKLGERFGTRVHILRSSRGGQIIIDYTSEEDLDRLYQELLKRE